MILQAAQLPRKRGEDGTKGHLIRLPSARGQDHSMVPQWGDSELPDGAQGGMGTSKGGVPWAHVRGTRQARICEKAVFLF